MSLALRTAYTLTAEELSQLTPVSIEVYLARVILGRNNTAKEALGCLSGGLYHSSPLSRLTPVAALSCQDRGFERISKRPEISEFYSASYYDGRRSASDAASRETHLLGTPVAVSLSTAVSKSNEQESRKKSGHGPGALPGDRSASWHSLADVNTLSIAGSARSLASSGSETRLEYAQ
jgi:hypothetical protein